MLEGHKISSLDGDMTLSVLYEVLLMFLTGNNRLEIRVYLTFLVLIHLFVNYIDNVVFIDFFKVFYKRFVYSTLIFLRKNLIRVFFNPLLTFTS